MLIAWSPSIKNSVNCYVNVGKENMVGFWVNVDTHSIGCYVNVVKNSVVCYVNVDKEHRVDGSSM